MRIYRSRIIELIYPSNTGKYIYIYIYIIAQLECTSYMMGERCYNPYSKADTCFSCENPIPHCPMCGGSDPNKLAWNPTCTRCSKEVLVEDKYGIK